MSLVARRLAQISDATTPDNARLRRDSRLLRHADCEFMLPSAQSLHGHITYPVSTLRRGSGNGWSLRAEVPRHAMHDGAKGGVKRSNNEEEGAAEEEPTEGTSEDGRVDDGRAPPPPRGAWPVRRARGGCAVLSLPASAAAGRPRLGRRVAEMEPREVRASVLRLSSALGGMPYSRACRIVASEPRLLDLPEGELLIRVRERALG